MKTETVKIQIGNKFMGVNGELVNAESAVLFAKADVTKPQWKRYLKMMARDHGTARLVAP